MNKKYKTTIMAVMTIICLMLISCGVGTNPKENINPVSEDSSSAATWKSIATLYADFSCGNDNALSNDIVKSDLNYSGELTAETLAKGLTELTGLDFFITATNTEDGGIQIDWAANSTLIANLDDREQKEEFHFLESDSLRWFMMDSMYRTVVGNLEVGNVYYTMDGGKELSFEDLSIVNVFPADSPFMGSIFYNTNADYTNQAMDGDGDVLDSSWAIDLVITAINKRDEIAPVIMETGEEIIDGEHALTFSAGSNSTDGAKYTAMYHYAVTDSEKVYYYDFLNNGGTWTLITW